MGLAGYWLSYAKYARSRLQTVQSTLALGDFVRLHCLTQPGVDALARWRCKFQGKSYSLIATDEAGQYADPSALDLLRSCLRAPLPMRPRFVIAANPGGPGHGWIVRRHVLAAPPWAAYVEPKTGRRFISCPSLFTDNPHLDQSEVSAPA
jgi:hypothetical protein